MTFEILCFLRWKKKKTPIFSGWKSKTVGVLGFSACPLHWSMFEHALETKGLLYFLWFSSSSPFLLFYVCSFCLIFSDRRKKGSQPVQTVLDLWFLGVSSPCLSVRLSIMNWRPINFILTPWAVWNCLFACVLFAGPQRAKKSDYHIKHGWWWRGAQWLSPVDVFCLIILFVIA